MAPGGCQVPKKHRTSLTQYLWLLPICLSPPPPALNLSLLGPGIPFPPSSSLSYIIQSFGGLLVHMCSLDPLGLPTWTQSILLAMLNLGSFRCL